MQTLHTYPASSGPGRAVRSMLTSCSRAVAIVGIILCGVPPASAQTWDTEPLAIVPGSASGVVFDSAGAVYLSGQLKDAAGSYKAAVYKSEDLGETWVESFASPDGSNLLAFSEMTFAKLPVGGGLFEDQILAVGWSKVTTSWGWIRGWEVYRSTDAGESWHSLTSEPYNSGYYSQQPKAIAVDSVGNVYVAGYAEERVQTKRSTTTYRHWIVRKGTPTPENGPNAFRWETVSDIRGTAGLTTWAFGTVCIGTDVFVAGTVNDVWQVQRSRDGGISWKVIDQYQL